MARMRLTRNFKFVDLIKIDGGSSVLREAGERLAVKVENRTMSGIDEDGRSFAPYSPAYAKRKLSRTVNLHGEPRPQMFADFGTTRATATGFTIGFRSAESQKKALIHQTGAGSMPERRFMGVPANWIADIKAWVVAHLPR